MTNVYCDADSCLHNRNGHCICERIRIDATEFNNDNTCPPICIAAFTKEE